MCMCNYHAQPVQSLDRSKRVRLLQLPCIIHCTQTRASREPGREKQSQLQELAIVRPLQYCAIYVQSSKAHTHMHRSDLVVRILYQLAISVKRAGGKINLKTMIACGHVANSSSILNRTSSSMYQHMSPPILQLVFLTDFRLLPQFSNI